MLVADTPTSVAHDRAARGRVDIAWLVLGVLVIALVLLLVLLVDYLAVLVRGVPS
ncbi:MAG: hypothetical protein RI958_2336 [Actinomycetota bacterium]